MQKISGLKSKQITQLYLDGESSLSISKKLEINPRTVITHLHKNGVQSRSHQEASILALKMNRLKVKLSKIPKQSKLLSKDKAYILGVLCGDGWIYYQNKSPKQTYQVGLNAIDKDFVYQFKDSLYKVYKISSDIKVRDRRKPNWNRQFEIKICSKNVCDDLLSFGNFKTSSWRIPQAIFESQPKVKAAFIKGFFDSEGYVSKKDRRVVGVSTNFDGLSEVSQLLKSLDIESRIKTDSIKSCYYLSITGRKCIERFLKLVDFSIKRKSLLLEKLVNSYVLEISLSKEVDRLFPDMVLLKNKGYTYEKIAKQLDISIGTVWRRLNIVTQRD